MIVPAPSLAAFLAARPLSRVHHGNGRHDSATSTVVVHPWVLGSRRVSSGRQRPHRRSPRRLGLYMQDFSSSAYWNKLYTGEDDAAEEAVTEWHVTADALIAPLDRLLGYPADDKELEIMNIGCGTSTLWARY